ncbi:hypothetical protein JD844_033332 [Phrynosoma platyrhinos]|uniref:Cytoplasmic dynein 2 heavy chain 1 n=1 Tax=Phrynosoma platyrhinos TaxID=52577 RepID=A0ABQ7T6R9_PHRPL|nr:hypothetical protein JD844_033332 [Phrynosoma platyrhinos]
MPLDGDGDGDKRKIFVSATAANYFGLSSFTSLAPLSSSPELANFLDDGNEFLLCVQHSEDQIRVSNKVEAGNSEDKMLVFFKLRPDVITEDNLHSNILVSSMLDSPVNMLYQAVRQVFAPVLLKDEKWSRDFDPKLQNLLRELEAGLGSVLKRTDTSSTGTKYREDDVQAILSPNDEFQFWTERAQRGSKSSSKERALHFKELFEAIAYDYYNLDSLSLFEVVDLVETTRDTVDDVWRQADHEPFPQQRMLNLLDVIAGSLGRFIQKKLGTFNLWEDSFHIVKENLKAGITICEQWVAACDHLTGQLWQRYTPHLWQAEKYIPEALSKLGKRLEEVLSIRTLHEKLTYFLPTGEQQALHLAQVFEPFAGLNPVHYNPYTEPLWKAAVRQYERIIAPAEQKIASKLKTFISEIQDSPQQVDDAIKIAEALLSDLSGFQKFQRTADELLEQFKVYEQEQFDDWSRDIQSGLSNPKSGLCIQASSPVMELDHSDGALKIHYSDRLVTLLREVRQLSALGFVIPAKIQQATNTAQKFCKQAVILKQVAHFYNSIDQQMIPSQKPMMLQSALAFEQIIKHSKAEGQITWDNPKELEAYIKKLQNAAERLATENRKLRKWHTNFTEKGFLSRDMKAWRQHWNHQLYKALEHQYQMGLEALNENLPEINIDLTYKQGRLQFKPPFEEVRARYYREMKRFISIPNQFKGVSETDEESIFSVMTERNASGFLTTFSKAEDLFRRLAEVADQFKEWVIIGQVDMEALVENHLFNEQDWEKNFKALKVRGKEVERLPSTVKVDCIIVNCNPVKSVVDDLIQKLYDILVMSLRKSIQAHLHDINSFLNDAMKTLVMRPQTVDEITEDNLKYKNLKEKKEEIFSLFQEADGKNKLLRTVAGGGIETISSLRATWDKFELMMESHHLMVKEQTTTLRKKGGNGKEVSDDGIHNDCSHFDLEEPDFSLASEIRSDIDSCSEVWALYEEFYEGFQEKANEDWITFRSKTYLFEEFLLNWHDKLRKIEEHTIMTVKLQKEVDKYKMTLPVLKYVRGEHLSPDHWLDLFRILGLPRGTSLESLVFGDLLKIADIIVEKAAELKDLNSRAHGEVTIREALRELELWGIGAVFMLTDYEDSQSRMIKLIKDWKDIVNQVGDNRCLLQSLKDSPYYKGFQDKVSVWERKLAELDEYLQNLNQIQRKWVYLEPIFGRGALPKEQARFNRVDEDFRSILADIKQDNRITSLNARAGIRNALITILDQLQRCQKSLNEFLEEKRSAFPRFYFIGDDDLLEILGQSTNPLVIQSHLKKLFAGIHSVSFDEDFKHIIAMKSLEGEAVPFKNKILLSNDVEVWLNKLSLEMKETLKQLLIDCVTAGKRSQGSIDPSLFPSQIICLAEQIQFTEDVECAIKECNLQQTELELMAKLEHYTSIDTNTEDPNNAEAGILELKLKALILDVIHNIDIVRQLNEAQIDSVDDWAWKKQLRFYLKDKKCYIQMVDAELQYTYEYQGIDVKSMGRIFVGLVKCGAWGCFDEFNRLEEAVLSAVSMQIQTIQHALKKHRPVCELLGKEVDMDHNSGIFITMNPAGKGYGGRQKLPDNLKQLFRPVAMTRPDNELIAEVILYSEGFKDAKPLGRKLVDIFNLARELLTPQQHYDWGLRALKTVLRGCGNLLRQLKKNGVKEKGVGLPFTRREEQRGLLSCFPSVPTQHDLLLIDLISLLDGWGQQKNSPVKLNTVNESHIVVQALRLNTMSKLTFADCARFDALAKDVFPGIDFKDVDYAELNNALQEAFEEANLEIIPTQIKKVLELYEQLRQRMGVVIVGPSGAGKSTLWHMLRAALGKVGKVVKQYTMNPKAMPRRQLLGHIDMDTREWSDGVLTNSARQVVREPPDVTSWIICDGDIDPEWIESLNSVLDDNRLLTMPSGERIHDEDTDLNSLIKSWLRNQPEECRQNLENWIGDYFEKALNWVLKQNDYVIETSLVGTVMNGLSHLQGCSERGQFIISLIRGLGGNLNMKSRQEFTKEVFTWARESPPNPNKPLDTYFDHDTQRLMSYLLKKPENLTADDFSNVQTLPVIQTPDMQRGLDYFKPWLGFDSKQPFLLVGPEGCGKGMLLRYAFSQLRSTQIATVHCSAQTTSRHLLQKLSQTCLVISTNMGRVYRPKDCERLVLYLKDINLPKPDKWGTSTLVAFLQQVLTYQGFYDENLEWVGLENIQIVASIYPERDQLQTIYSAYLEPVLHKNLKNHPAWGSLAKIHQLAGSMVQVYEQIRAKFTVDDHSHYLFTPCILTQWVLGLFRYDLTGGASTHMVDTVLEIVAYEARRLFRDKIVGTKELHVFDNILMKVFQGDWGSDILDNMADSFYVTWGARHELGTVMAPGQTLPPHGRPLGKLNTADLKDVIRKGIIHYGRDNHEIEILLFPEVLDYVSRVDRVLSFPGGSLLLAGHSGVGRRTVTSLVSHMHGAILITPKISRGYEMKQFKNDLKHVMQLAGIEAQHVVLLLEDYQFVQSTFLEMVNSLLSSGIQQNLHVVLIMDSTNMNFTINCESNPALHKKCQVLWMESWSESSMKKITSDAPVEQPRKAYKKASSEHAHSPEPRKKTSKRHHSLEKEASKPVEPATKKLRTRPDKAKHRLALETEPPVLACSKSPSLTPGPSSAVSIPPPRMATSLIRAPISNSESEGEIREEIPPLEMEQTTAIPKDTANLGTEADEAFLDPETDRLLRDNPDLIFDSLTGRFLQYVDLASLSAKSCQRRVSPSPLRTAVQRPHHSPSRRLSRSRSVSPSPPRRLPLKHQQAHWEASRSR